MISATLDGITITLRWGDPKLFERKIREYAASIDVPVSFVQKMRPYA